MFGTAYRGALVERFEAPSLHPSLGQSRGAQRRKFPSDTERRLLRVIPVVTAIVAAVFAGAIAAYRERRLELAALLVAARVVGAALDSAIVDVELAAQEGFPIDFVPSPIVAWVEHRSVLARHLGEEQWAAVGYGVGVIETLESFEGRTDLAGLIPEGADHVRRAIAVLDAYAKQAGRVHNPGRRALVPATPVEDQQV